MHDQRPAYTGVGSRKTPEPILVLMQTLAQALSSLGFTLRSGAAEGADSAFEAGSGEAKEIYLPWRGFNGNSSQFYVITDEALELAAKVHPAWNRLSPAARKLHARNCYQVLGAALDAPSQFLVCWTPDGAVHPRECTRATGGTGTAIRLAALYGVPVFNLSRADHRERAEEYVAAAPCTSLRGATLI